MALTEAKKQFNETQLDWIPLRQAVFVFGVSMQGEYERSLGDPSYELTEADIIKIKAASWYVYNKLETQLQEDSGAIWAAFDPTNLKFSFLMKREKAGYLVDDTPWAILADEFNKAKVTAQQAVAIRETTDRVWQQVVRSFARAVSLGTAALFARHPTISTSFERLPAGMWPQLDVRDWQNGVAIPRDGAPYFAIHARRPAWISPFTATNLPAPSFLNADRNEFVYCEIKAVYDEADAAGDKPPNLRELPVIVLPRLKAKGHWNVSGNKIMKIGKAFADRRRPVGKTVRSERAKLR
jgi:hypothetical protein